MNTKWKTVTPAADIFVDAAIKDAARTLLVFDFDGTLAKIVPNPQDARIVEASASALARLAAEGVQTAIISGRPVATLLELSSAANQPGLAQATIFGQYGAERLNMATGENVFPEPPASIGAAKMDLEEIAKQHPGAHVEDKGLAVALHVRNTEDADEVFAQVEQAARNVASKHELTVEPGRFVWELRAATVTKGDALSALIAEVRPAAALFAGDDLGDLAALDVLEQVREQSDIVTCALISASAEAPQLAERADVLADGPDGIAAWLNALADRLATAS